MPTFRHPDHFDYFSIDGLIRVSGAKEKHLIKLAVKELVDNALDAGTCDIGMLGRNGFYVQDFGPGIPGEDHEIAQLFSCTRETYSTKGDRYPRRGALGTGLRFVMGVVYCFKAEMKVATMGRVLKLTPTNSGTEYQVLDTYSGPGTRIEVTFPDSKVLQPDVLEWGRLAIELARGKEYRGPGSPHWYDELEFVKILNSLDPGGMRIIDNLRQIFGPRCKLKSLRLDDGLLAILKSRTRMSISVDDATRIITELRRILRPISPKRLGYVGTLEDFLYYKRITGTFSHPAVGVSVKAVIPFSVEIWVRTLKTGEERGYTRFFVNRSPVAMDHLVHYEWERDRKLLISRDSLSLLLNVKPIRCVIYINVVTPFLPRRTDSKLPEIPQEIKHEIERACEKLLTKLARKAGRSRQRKKTWVTPEVMALLRKQKETIAICVGDDMFEPESRKRLKVLKNDPFYPTEGDASKALWFKSIWEKFNPSGKPVHLRRLHYQLVSQPLDNQVTTHHGKVYENRENYWDYLIEAAKSAREFGLIDPMLIVDMRNPEPVGEFVERFDLLYEVLPSRLMLPEIDYSLIQEIGIEFPVLKVNPDLALRYISGLHPVHLEIWTEKSTMNDILIEICSNYGILLVQNTGYSSITGIERFLRERALRTQKPSVILFISDFDEAGENMPVTVSRTIQHRLALMRGQGLYTDKLIAVIPIILTKQQMELPEFQSLPKSPSRRGTGTVTELDALEALMPGKFKDIVEENVRRFLNPNLKDQVRSRLLDLAEAFKKQISECDQELAQEMQRLQLEIERVRSKIAPLMEKIAVEIENEVYPLRSIYSALKERLNENAKILSDKLVQEFNRDFSEHHKTFSLDDALFLSTRSFLEQTIMLQEYRVHTKGSRGKK